MPSPIQAVFTDKAPTPIGPYSQAVKLNNLIFVSGLIPLIPNTNELDQSSFESEVKRIFLSLSEILDAAGSSLKHVAKVTVYLKNMTDFTVFNDLYATYFTAPYPARVTVEVSRLPKNVSVEIDAIAVIPSSLL